MEDAGRILRRSANAFLRDYHTFASIASLLVFPVSAATLLSQALVPPSSPLVASVRSRLAAVFAAAGFPASSELFSYLSLKFSQTALSFALTFPFVLTFLVLAKAAVVQFALSGSRRPPPLLSLLGLYHPLLQTHLCNALVVLSANAAAFALVSIAFNLADASGATTSGGAVLCLSAAGAVIYSVFLANALVACNMAVVVSGAEGCGGCLPVVKACLLLRGRAATALSLALPGNLLMAAAEALFQTRVVMPYRAANSWSLALAWEGIVIAHIYSLLIVFDIVVTCIFFESCKQQGCSSDWSAAIHPEEDDDDASAVMRPKLRELP